NGRRVIAALAKHVRRARREADETRLVSGEKPVVREDVVEILAGGIDRLNVLREPLVKESAAFLVELPEDRFASVRMEEAHERLVPVRLPLRSLVRRIGGRGRVVPVPALFPALSGTLDVDLFDEVPRDEEVDLRVELASAHAHTLLEHSNRDGPPRRRDPLDRLPLLRRERFDSRSDEMIERARKSDLVDAVGEHPTAAAQGRGAFLDERARELDEKERVAFGCPRQPVENGVGNVRLLEDLLEERGALRVVEARELDLGNIAQAERGALRL